MSPRMASRRWHLAVRLAVVALVWSAGLVLAGLLVPAYTTNAVSEVNGVTITHSTLVQENGLRAMALVAAPLLVSCVVLWAIRARRSGARWGGPVAWLAVAVVTAEAFVGILTIGVFILPAALLLAAAVRLAPGPGPGGDAVSDVSATPAAGT